MPCRLVKVNQHFIGTYIVSALSSGFKDTPSKNQQETGSSCLFFFSLIFLGLPFNPENEGDIFL
jgi:hypothetical protein